jgi:hypothetical protein
MVDRILVFQVSFFFIDSWQEIDESIIVVDYYIGVISYIALSFDVLIVNYRGSIGFGQGK